MQPNLYIIGFQKCGSSLLFDLLSKHSEITGSTPKETFYLTDKNYENYDFRKSIHNPETSWKHFYPERDNKTLYHLEASVCNFHQDTALDYIANSKKAKVLLIVRNPVDRFVSNYKYYTGNIPKIDPSVSLLEYYNNVKQGKYSLDSLKYAIEHGKYLKYINLWKNRLGKDRVRLVSFKKLINQPEIELANIFDFLGLKFDGNKIELEKVNESKKVKNSGLHQFLIRYFSSDFPLKNLLKKLYYKTFTEKRNVVLSKEVEDLLKNEYESELEILKDYF